MLPGSAGRERRELYVCKRVAGAGWGEGIAFRPRSDHIWNGVRLFDDV